MKILHYFLGFPPYRSGGLTKFTTDLMHHQAQIGHEVTALWPGQMKLWDKTPNVARRNNVGPIRNFEIINPLPVPLIQGIRDQKEFMRPCDSSLYSAFLKDTAPDVIHIHTLMGLHKELIGSAKALGIPLVFTTHDYFGICPKATLFKAEGTVCEGDEACEGCFACNAQAISYRNIILGQSPLYRRLKNTGAMKSLKSLYFKAKREPAEEAAPPREAPAQYQALRRFYLEMLGLMDCIHFNSSLTKRIYEKHLTPANSIVIPITHQHIKDHRASLAQTAHPSLRITYLGPMQEHKGFFVLKKALDRLWNDGQRFFELRMFGHMTQPAPYMKISDSKYDYSDFFEIFADTDVLIAPSIWYETFGFTVLEALSFGVPVIVTENIGARDIVADAGIVIAPNSAEAIEQALMSLTPQKLAELKEKAAQNPNLVLQEEMGQELDDLYGSLLK